VRAQEWDDDALIMLLLAVHLLAAVFWVGGMACIWCFARGGSARSGRCGCRSGGACSPILPWVGVSVVALLASGVAMIFLAFDKPSSAPPYVQVMATTGIVMMLLFLHLIFAPWRRFRDAVDRGALPEAAKSLNQIRIIVGINLLLGILTIVIGGTGRYW
jgi:uncharacterized membrane protein